MRLPIQSMQSVRLRPLEGDTDRWYRSVIVDFEERDELVLLLPGEKDREKEGGDSGDPAAGPEEGSAGDEGSTEEPQTADPAPVADPLPGTDAGIRAEAGEEAGAPTGGGGEAEGHAGSGAGSSKVVGDSDEFVKPPPFTRGTPVEVEISFPDGIRRFTTIVRRLDANYGGVMRIEWPREGTRIQRRDFVRVDVTYRALAWYRTAEGEKLQQLNGWTLDISAGGARLKLTEPLPAGQRIEVEIQHAWLNNRTLQGRVVRSGQIERKRNEPQFYWVAVEFLGVDEGLRNELTQLVFNIQREQMKKSLT